MHGFARVFGTAAIAATAIALAACGGLGVNVSGNSNSPNQVAITAISGVTINPYPVEIGHTTFLTAHPSAGNVINYGVAQAVRWDSSNPASVQLLEGDCSTAYGANSSRRYASVRPAPAQQTWTARRATAQSARSA